MKILNIFQGTLNYFMLEGYFRRVQSTVAEANKRLGFDPVLTLYKGLSLLNESKLCAFLSIFSILYRMF